MTNKVYTELALKIIYEAGEIRKFLERAVKALETYNTAMLKPRMLCPSSAKDSQSDRIKRALQSDWIKKASHTCPACGRMQSVPNLEQTGPHTKASCRACGAYIKMLSAEELGVIEAILRGKI